MKVALCLFGIVGGSAGKDGKGGDLDPSIAHGYVKEHILDKNDVDVFIHSWSVNKKDELLNLYKPVRWIIEPQIIFNKNPNIHRAYSRWYSTHKSINLIDGDYDMVMLSRMDVAYFTDIVFDDYDPEYFYASHWNDTGNRANHHHGFLDLWFFGGADVMRKFGQLSLYIDNYEVSQHRSSQQHAFKMIGEDKIRYAMYRGEDFKLVRRVI